METWPPLIYFRMSGWYFIWCLRSCSHIPKFPTLPLGHKMPHSSQAPWRFPLLFLALLFLLEFRREPHVVLFKIWAWTEFAQQGILWFSTSSHLIWPLKCFRDLPLLSEQILSPVLHFPRTPTIFGAALLTVYLILVDAWSVPPGKRHNSWVKHAETSGMPGAHEQSLAPRWNKDNCKLQHASQTRCTLQNPSQVWIPFNLQLPKCFRCSLARNNHRVVEQFGQEGSLEIIQFQPSSMGTPSTRQGCFRPYPTGQTQRTWMTPLLLPVQQALKSTNQSTVSQQ